MKKILTKTAFLSFSCLALTASIALPYSSASTSPLNSPPDSFKVSTFTTANKKAIQHCNGLKKDGDYSSCVRKVFNVYYPSFTNNLTSTKSEDGGVIDAIY